MLSMQQFFFQAQETTLLLIVWVESQADKLNVLLSERAMGQVLTGTSVQGFSNLNDAFEALENGSIDYVAQMHMLVLI